MTYKQNVLHVVVLTVCITTDCTTTTVVHRGGSSYQPGGPQKHPIRYLSLIPTYMSKKHRMCNLSHCHDEGFEPTVRLPTDESARSG